MFGRRKREITRLTEENATLSAQLGEIQADPYYALAQEIGAEVESIVSSGVNTDTRIEDAIRRRRAALYAARINELAEAQINDQTTAEKAAIQQAAMVEANKLAAAALNRFLEDEAAAYREQVEAELNARRPEEVIAEAKRQIAADLRAERVGAAKARLLAEKKDAVALEVLKTRAQELRERTKKTGILRWDMLEDGDPLVIGFAKPGKSSEPLSNTDWYENRRLSGHIVDKDEGIFEIAKDCWFQNPKTRSQALRGGQQVRLLAADPYQETEDLLSQGVKGEPLIIQNIAGVQLPNDETELWWIKFTNGKGPRIL